MSSRNFFLNAFGFIEEQSYGSNLSKLVSNARFKSENFVIAAIPSYNGIGGEANIPPVIVPREHCVIQNVTSSERTVDCGLFSTPSVSELRAIVTERLRDSRVTAALAQYRRASGNATSGMVSVGHVVGDSRKLHAEPQFRGSVFQAASQFNYLEFPSPSCIPENGITCYIYDRTQGPACAVACAAGTAYRNYLGLVDKGRAFSQGDVSASNATSLSRGQTASLQYNGLAEIEEALGGIGRYFDVRNGYVDSDRVRLESLNRILLTGGAPSSQSASSSSSSSNAIDFNSPTVEALIGKLRIGVQQNTEVTDLVASSSSSRFLVTQTYNSALSVGYSRLDSKLWEPLACLVLAASYEATMLVGVLQAVDAIEALFVANDNNNSNNGINNGATMMGDPEASNASTVSYHLHINEVSQQGPPPAACSSPSPTMLSPSAYAFTAAGKHGKHGNKAFASLPTPPPLVLTKVGGGVFGNHSDWILRAMERSFNRVTALGVPLNVAVTHFGSVEREYAVLKQVY